MGLGPGRPHKDLSCGAHTCGATFLLTGVPFSFLFDLLLSSCKAVGLYM